MYCENCGTQMNLGKYCPNCGYAAQPPKAEEKAPFNEPIDALPVYNPVNDVPIYNPVNDVPSFNLVKKEKPLTKCIWFAPVTTAVIAIFLTISSSLSGFLSNLLYSLSGSNSSWLFSGISTLISGIVIFSLVLALSLGLYALAFKKRFKNHIPMIFLPYASYSIACLFANIFSSPIYYFAQFLLYEGDLRASTYSFVITANNIIRAIVILVISILVSTLIAVKYLKRAEATRKELEEYKEKAEETIE